MSGGVVVVGGGFGALEIALALRKEDDAIAVTVITNETEIVYRPWLIRVPAGDPQPPVIPLARLLASAGANVVTGRAVGIDLDQRHVRLDSGAQIDYAQLAVGVGWLPAISGPALDPGHRSGRRSQSGRRPS
jgi:NADH dehydrogenase FAD-containing subunit